MNVSNNARYTIPTKRFNPDPSGWLLIWYVGGLAALAAWHFAS